jgi:VWFA-related protein
MIALVAALAVAGQSSTPTPRPTDDSVLRISTNLVQTGVLVTNKQGEIVRGLKKEDFQLFVDGKAVTPDFFEPVHSRSPKRAGEAAATVGETAVTAAALSDARRTMAFVVDDLHMSFESLVRTRRVIQDFIHNQMLPSDRVAIVASSGRVGFLQQFTNDKDMLLKACERLEFGQKTGDQAGPPPMNEFEAQTIERGDGDLISRFVSLTIRYNPGMNRNQAYTLVRARARAILSNTGAYTRNTLGAVEGSATASANFPGRKAIYFFSDGMLLDPGNSDTPDVLRKITSAAARANVVIYSFDAKGLEGFPLGNSVDSPDMSSNALSLQASEKFERQDALNYFAAKTGGRFIKNTNDLKGNLQAVTQEAFQYYLLAWEPVENSAGKFHQIEIRLPGRPDLRVSYQTGYLDRSSQTDGRDAVPPTTTSPVVAEPVGQPAGGLPTYLSLNYLRLAKDGLSLSATIDVDPAAVSFQSSGSEMVADLELTISLFNDKGASQAAFKVPLHMAAPSANSAKRPKEIRYDYQVPLKPGLYQVRVKARDPRSGRVGAAAAWLEIPSVSKTSLSSLLVGEIRDAGPDGGRSLDRNVERRFSRNALLQFLGFIYPSDPKKFSRPNVRIRADVMQASKSFLSREGAITEIAGSDASHVSYSGVLPLDELAPGHYELCVTITGAGDKPMIRRTYFEVVN